MEKRIEQAIKNATPFTGSNESWVFYHGNKAEEKKQKYINECNARLEKLKKKL